MTTNDPTSSTTDVAPAALAEGDPRLAFARAVRLGGQVIGAVRPDQLADPTPCPGFDVRSLLGHLVEVLDRVAVIGRGENPFVPGSRPPVADDGWLAAWQAAAHAVRAAWTDDAVLERIVTLPWSQVSGGQTLCGYLNEVTVHTWDLASATGQRPAWDDAVVATAFAAISQVLPSTGRAAKIAEVRASMPPPMRDFPPPFAEAVEVDADVPAIDRLVAFNGRRPALVGQA